MSEHGRGDVEVAVVGNKCDLSSDKKIDSRQGESTATKLGCHFYESSAKDNLNIENVFMGLVRNILVNMPLERPPDNHEATSLKDLDSNIDTPAGCSC